NPPETAKTRAEHSRNPPETMWRWGHISPSKCVRVEKVTEQGRNGPEANFTCCLKDLRQHLNNCAQALMVVPRSRVGKGALAPCPPHHSPNEKPGTPRTSPPQSAGKSPRFT